MMKLKIHPLIIIFIVGDFVLMSGWALISPIFALFVVRNIENGTATIVGIAAAIYWISKSLFQIPIALYLDKHKGEKDDFTALIGGFILAGLVSFSFLLVKTPLQLYVLQLFQALAFALILPSWSAIFTRHIDKGKEALEWGLDSTALGLGAGISGFIGGIMADKLGFEPIFVAVGIISLLTAFFPIWTYLKYGASQKDHSKVFSPKSTNKNVALH